MSIHIRKVLFFAFVMTICSCHQQINQSDLSLLNGYWEITKVVLEDGSEKEYKINETIDLFYIKGSEGFRKKVKPQFDGSFIDIGLQESISVDFKDKKAFLGYKTPYSSWKEEILELSEDIMVLKNENNMVYHYKKYVPFNIIEDGKKAQ